MTILAVIAGLLALVTVLLLGGGWGRLMRRRFLGAGLFTLTAVLCLTVFGLVLLVISNLTTYHRLTAEKDIMLVSISRISAQNYQVELNYVDVENNPGPRTVYLLGDEWRIEARILKWKGWANLLGMDSYYQLDRISGRYRDIQQATSRPVSAFQLGGLEPQGLNLWELKRVLKSNLPFIDAYFGQAVYLPLHDGAIYAVSINQSGLLARAANKAAEQALKDW